MNETIIKDSSKKLQDLKIKNIKYKIYIFIWLVFIYIFWPYFTESIDNVKNLKEEISKIEKQIWEINIDINEANNFVQTTDNIEKNKTNIVSCLNSNNSCDDLDFISNSTWTNIDIIRNYLLINKLVQYKMEFDQRKILKNINEFLLKDVSWLINIISFWSVKLIDYDRWIYELPLTLNIDFSDKNSLLKFIGNIERNIDLENLLYYRIMSMNYNVVNYEQSQTVNVSLNIYFYK